MSLEHILLGLLREPATGYELRADFEHNVRHFWSAELSQIYPTLQRLEDKGFLRSRTEPSPKGPDRRVYRRTAAGRRELKQWLLSGPQVGTERFAYLAQLYFMDEVGDLAETRAFLVRLRDNHVRWLAELRAIEQQITETYGDRPDRYCEMGIHRFAALRMGILSIGAKVAWCDETIATLGSRLGRETDDRETVEEEV